MAKNRSGQVLSGFTTDPGTKAPVRRQTGHFPGHFLTSGPLYPIGSMYGILMLT